MGDEPQIRSARTVYTVASATCDYCGTTLPAPRNHNGEVRRFCPGNRCRSGWHAREKRRSLEHAREALRAALVALDGLLTRK